MTERKTSGHKQLEAAGFEVVKAHPGAKWFEVLTPGDKAPAAVLRQSEHCWHWFSKEHAWTASDSSVESCHKGGLGDAIDTDSRMKTYKRLLKEQNVPPKLRKYEGVFAAMQQVD